MTTPEGDEPHFDRDAVRARYLAERAKRMTASRGALLDLRNREEFADYQADPFTRFAERDPVSRTCDVAIIGAGMAGLVVGAKLRAAGVRDIVLIDEAGGVGGSWYWNRYPGVMCDIESYVYMPMLEELGSLPSMKYAAGAEILQHLQAIANKYDLTNNVITHARVESSVWNESSAKWIVRTSRDDEVEAHYLIMAVGVLNTLKLPAIRGMETFRGDSFHCARWDYDYTGGSPTEPDLDKLTDKTVGLVGTGASAIQALPALARSAQHVYVYQRTPSAIGSRDNAATTPEFAAELETGWQRSRMDNFTAVMLGEETHEDLVRDGWTTYMAAVSNPRVPDSLRDSVDPRTWAEELDYTIMEIHRDRIDQAVSDSATAEILKPHYRYLCKRPCFHDEYLDAFNSSNVTLVDCPTGLERITPTGAVANGIEHRLDCLIYATGFEAELTPFARRAGHKIVGRGSVTIEEKWRHGVRSLHGMATSGFPNLLIMPAPGQQAVTTVNYTHLVMIGAEHIAATVAMLDRTHAEGFDVEGAAEAAWAEEIVRTYRDGSAFISSCTPSRLNFEGDPAMAIPLNGSFGGGYGDVFGFERLLAAWREEGNFDGWEVF